MKTPILFLCLLFAAPLALAGEPINETRDLAADGSVRVDNLKGGITVRTWDRPQVKLTGTLGEGVEALRIEGGPGELRIEVRYPKGGGWFGWWGGGDRAEASHLELTVPRGASLDVDTVSAVVDVQGLAGRRLSVDTVSGEVTVRDCRVEEAVIDGVSGDADLALDAGRLSVDLVSGDLSLGGTVRDRLSVDTVSGDAEVELRSVQRATLGTVSGDGELRTSLAPGGSIQAETVSGGLRLRLPAGTSARLRAESFSGRISSPVGEVEREEYGPGQRLDTRLGAGDGDIRLETFSGSIRLELEPE